MQWPGGMNVFPLSVPVTHPAGGPRGSRPPPGLPRPAATCTHCFRSPGLGSGYVFIMTTVQDPKAQGQEFAQMSQIYVDSINPCPPLPAGRRNGVSIVLPHG